MNHGSNFIRQPAIQMFSGECQEHGKVDLAHVEQFDGSVLVQGCRRCYWADLNTAAADSFEHSEALARQKAERLNSALIGSGITPRFAGCTFDNYRTNGGSADMVKALETCRGYADGFEDHYLYGRNLLLLGNLGTGKTHLAAAIAKQIISNLGASALIVSAAEIIRVAKGVMSKGATYSERDVIDELASVDLLIIDEIGAQAGTAYELGVLHEVIDRRYQLIKPSMVISNMDAKGLGQYIGDRALDRLRENKALLAGFTWTSARGRT
jgi:DNA replication protein DnaC